MPPRVLFCDSLPFWGGGEHWIVVAARGLADRGWQTMVAGRTGSELLTRATAAGIESIAWSYRRDFHPGTMASAWHHLRRERPDVVVVTTGRDVRTVGIVARWLGIPVVWAMGVPLPNRGWAHRITGKHVISCVVVPSQDLRNRLSPFPWLDGKVVIIPHGIGTIAEPTPEQVARARAALGWHDQEFVILYAGRLESRKGVDVLLSALASLAGSFPDVRLAIVGAGTAENQLHALAESLGISPRVQFLGYQRDVGFFYDACDLVVVPSRWEPFGFVLLEAMARARPVIASRVDGIPEVTGDDGAFLVPPDDTGKLGAAIDTLMRDRPRRLALAQAGMARVRAMFTESLMIDRIEALFNRLMNERDGSYRSHE